MSERFLSREQFLSSLLADVVDIFAKFYLSSWGFQRRLRPRYKLCLKPFSSPSLPRCLLPDCQCRASPSRLCHIHTGHYL